MQGGLKGKESAASCVREWTGHGLTRPLDGAIKVAIVITIVITKHWSRGRMFLVEGVG